MKVTFDNDFYKQYKKLDVRIQNSFDEQLRIFRRDPTNPKLDDHSLKNEWQGFRSVIITADYRAIYKKMLVGKDRWAYFVALGTHKQLYRKSKAD